MKYLALLLLSASLYAQRAITLTSDSTFCTSANPCTLQIYRATCGGTGGPMGGPTCPFYPDPAFLQLANNANTLAGTTIDSTGTKWIYHDVNGDSTRPDLVPALVYTYVQTAIYNGDPTRTASYPSNNLVMPFQLNVANPPVYPITGTCYIVK